MTTRFSKARFHTDFGPSALFERVRDVYRGSRSLSLTDHFNQRVAEREIPSEVLSSLAEFDQADWTLMTVEVRTDKGKFVNSTWAREFGSMIYWITIGFNDSVETIYPKDVRDSGFSYVKSGELYEFVSRVNQGLLEESRSMQQQ